MLKTLDEKFGELRSCLERDDIWGAAYITRRFPKEVFTDRVAPYLMGKLRGRQHFEPVFRVNTVYDGALLTMFRELFGEPVEAHTNGYNADVNATTYVYEDGTRLHVHNKPSVNPRHTNVLAGRDKATRYGFKALVSLAERRGYDTYAIDNGGKKGLLFHHRRVWVAWFDTLAWQFMEPNPGYIGSHLPGWAARHLGTTTREHVQAIHESILLDMTDDTMIDEFFYARDEGGYDRILRG